MPDTHAPVVIDSLLPPDVAEKAESVGTQKGEMNALSLFLLAVLAGAFIALGSVFYTVAVTGTAEYVGYGITKILGGLAFCLGLVLVVIGGAELFTGNNLLIMALVGRRISLRALLRNWVIVYIGNFVGALVTAWLIAISLYHTQDGNNVGLTAMGVAEAKCSLPFIAALVRGIYCNALVCLAVWLTYSCRTTGDKILAIVFPITAFVAAGFEHCVANMYFIPYALFIKTGLNRPGFEHVTWGNFLVDNLLPVTIGNIIGGAIFVGLCYWLIYQRAELKQARGEKQA